MSSFTPHSVPKGYTQVTSLSSAAGLGTVPAGSAYATVQCEAQQVRWRDDGTSPTTSVGSIMNVGDTLIYDGEPSAIKFIEVTSGAKLNISWYAA